MSNGSESSRARDPAAGIRLILLAALALGIAGTAIELVLINHLEDWQQWIPLVALAASALTIAWSVARRSALAVRAVQVCMLGLIAAGLVGVGLHLSESLEFQEELTPSLSRVELLRKALGATAPPALAPASLAQLGLVGLAYTFRHPGLKRSTEE